MVLDGETGMRRISAVLATTLLTLSACGYVDDYEKQVYDEEPTYCYQSLGEIKCFREPFHRDSKRLVNYYGPHPSRYDAPEEPEKAPLKAPARITRWVKDPEPVVGQTYRQDWKTVGLKNDDEIRLNLDQDQ